LDKEPRILLFVEGGKAMYGQRFVDFAKASGTTIAKFGRLHNAVARSLVGVADALEAAVRVRRALVTAGFQYDGDSFLFQDVVARRRGNCLGLSLLVAAFLEEHDIPYAFDIITRPKDAVDAEDKRLFAELLRGEHFDYDNPPLPTLAERPACPPHRFAPVEHPVLVVGGKRFEATSIEDLEEDPFWTPEAELVRTANFNAVLSNVYVDRAQMLLDSDPIDPLLMKSLLTQGLEMWRENREGWLLLWRVAVELKDTDVQNVAAANYKRIGGEDSRWRYGMYLITRDTAHLDAALNRFPASVLAFVERRAVLESDNREARFNFATASWCVANSSVLNLEKFYQEHKQTICRLFGRDAYKGLFMTKKGVRNVR
jgi:hypothetical protein